MSSIVYQQCRLACLPINYHHSSSLPSLSFNGDRHLGSQHGSRPFFLFVPHCGATMIIPHSWSTDSTVQWPLGQKPPSGLITRTTRRCSCVSFGYEETELKLHRQRKAPQGGSRLSPLAAAIPGLMYRLFRRAFVVVICARTRSVWQVGRTALLDRCACARERHPGRDGRGCWV